MELNTGHEQRRVKWWLVAGSFLRRLAMGARSVLSQEFEGPCAWDELVEEWQREPGFSKALSDRLRVEPMGPTAT